MATRRPKPTEEQAKKSAATQKRVVKKAKAAKKRAQDDPNAAPAQTKRIAKMGSRGKLCAALKRGQDTDSGERCGHKAGWGTTHPGYGRCKLHGGNTPSMIKAAEKQLVAERMAQNAVFGNKRDIGPHEALMEEVQRTAGHVEWLGDKVKSLEDGQLTQYTAKDGIKPSEWIAMYQEERRMLVSVCNVAIRAGIAERTVRIAEEQGKIIAMALMRFIHDANLALTPTQMLVAPKLVRNLLLELPSADADQSKKKVQVGDDIIEVEVLPER